MKVLLINGSPHANGNTSIALTEVAKTLEAEGIETVSVYPVTDDYEEKDVKKALDALKGQDFDFLVVILFYNN